MIVSASRPVRFVIDAIEVIDATLRRYFIVSRYYTIAGRQIGTLASNSTCRRPPTWLPARQVPQGIM